MTARRELPLLKQEGQSVETRAAKFKNIIKCITEGIAIDSTTLAVYFQQGLTRRTSSALVSSQSIATMQDLALVMAAAEEIEYKLDLSVKQAQVEVPATGNPNPSKHGRYDNRGIGIGTAFVVVEMAPLAGVWVASCQGLGCQLPGFGLPVAGTSANAS